MPNAWDIESEREQLRGFEARADALHAKELQWVLVAISGNVWNL